MLPFQLLARMLRPSPTLGVAERRILLNCMSPGYYGAPLGLALLA